MTDDAIQDDGTEAGQAVIPEAMRSGTAREVAEVAPGNRATEASDDAEASVAAEATDAAGIAGNAVSSDSPSTSADLAAGDEFESGAPDESRDLPPALPPAPSKPAVARPAFTFDWYKIALVAVILVAAYLRFLGPPERITYMNKPPEGLTGLQQWIRSGDWDSGTHLHPDERFLTMVADAVSLPANLSEYFHTESSPLNPRNVGHAFYVYGSLPMTIVVMVANAIGMSDYSTVHLVGRKLMALSDLAAILLLYWWASRRYGRRVALLAASLSAFTAFAIQQSHFFTVDTAANFFVLIALFAAESLLERGSYAEAIIAGLALGAALASKMSVWPLALVLLVVLYFTSRHLTTRQGEVTDAGDVALPSGPFQLGRFLGLGVALALAAFVVLRIGQPDMWVGPGWPAIKASPERYAEFSSKGPSWWTTIENLMPDALEPLLLPDPRWADNMRQVRDYVSGHGVDWPPNHQWWGRTPFLFPLRNMVVYGMGWPLGVAAWLGWLVAAWLVIRRRRRRLMVPVLWVGLLFGSLGGQWVASMRYFLPIYPALSLLAAWLLVAIYDWTRGGRFDAAGETTAQGDGAGSPILKRLGLIRRPLVGAALLVLVLGGTALWGFMFSRIYTREHSRVAGSRWLYRHVPSLIAAALQPSDEGQYLPLTASTTLSFDPEGKFVVDGDRLLDRMRLEVPTVRDVTMTGVLLRHLTDPNGDPQPEVLRAFVTDHPDVDAAGRPNGELARGELSVPLDQTKPEDVTVKLAQPLVLKPGGEYYVWVELAGGPIAGKQVTLGSETHWDDMIPTGGREAVSPWDNLETPNADGVYGGTNTELYDEDDLGKVDRLVDWLQKSDYIAITSNRVYGAIAQIPTRYPMTLKYYELLFNGKLGFKHIADIHSYPSLGRFEIDDQPAEEAFHVYDHPKVDVFQKTDAFDPVLTKRILVPEVAKRHWEWPTEGGGGIVSRIIETILAKLPGSSGAPAAASGPKPLSSVMLSESRVEAERNGPSWRTMFDIGSPLNQQPILAIVVWYLALALLGLFAFPLAATALGNLADRGWAISRVIGLLLTGWFAWWIASLRLAAHTPLLVTACALLLALVSAAVGWRGRHELRRWVLANRRLILVEELLFLALFAVFLVIRLWNPDLWHPYFGGEKPMDFAYLNATLRSVSFPPYDPWFSGGKLNYYYYGFVFIGALMELTHIVPWLAYNLAIPSLAAMTGLGVFGLVYHWSRWMQRSSATGMAAGGLGAVLAVLCGNLYQVQYIGNNMANMGRAEFQSEIPGVMFLTRLLTGFVEGLKVWLATGFPPVDRFNHLYWNASRAIPAYGDVEPITEFPFFTFLYADLHAHMMALPLTVLAFTVALSWASPSRDELRAEGWFHPWQALRLALGAVAIGSLWPANTWDFPTYGLVAAGAMACGLWQTRPKLDFGWLVRWAGQGAVLLVLALLAFAPYHLNYVTPYSNFKSWDSYRTAFDAYLTVHGLFLFAIVTWALFMFRRVLARGADSRAHWQATTNALKIGVAGAFAILVLYARAAGRWEVGKVGGPSLALAVFVAVALCLGLAVLAWRPTRPGERFAAWIFVLGLVLTQFVENVVLDGDMGRMNTVFKFYIQVWIMWATLAAVAVAWLAPWLRRASRPASAWLNAFGLLVLCGLLYTFTASRAKMSDRFDPMAGISETERAALEASKQPGLSGIAYMDHAVYDDDGHPLHLRYDRDAILWMLQNVEGNPVILEWSRDSLYKWGSRYAIYTGLPSVLGWDWHQKQQRNAVGGEVVSQRLNDSHEIYNTTDDERAWKLLEDYRVEYVIVGEQETAFASAEGLAKFRRWETEGKAKVVYTVKDPADPFTFKVTIFQLVRPGVATR